MLLGGYADPRTGQPVLDLEGAREMIDMLDVLREKTHGKSGAGRRYSSSGCAGQFEAGLYGNGQSRREARKGPVPALIEDPPCPQHLIPYSNLRCLVPARPWECRRSRAIAAVCSSTDPRDKRLRPSILLVHNGQTAVIDTTPDFRFQAMRAGLERLDAILFTHAHADHILGLTTFARLICGRNRRCRCTHRRKPSPR